MRYKVMVSEAPPEPGVTTPFELQGQRRRNKREISNWIADHILKLGLDWRVGFKIKFISGPEVYTWLKISDGSEVKPKGYRGGNDDPEM